MRSISTMGRSDPYVSIQKLRDQLRFERLVEVTAGAERAARIKSILKGTGVRFHRHLGPATEKVREEGGPVEAGNRALALQNASAKITYLCGFPGIGPKYAQNIWMDLADKDFHEYVAVDTRIKNILRDINVPVRPGWHDAEGWFVLDAAHAAGLSGWEADRLIYGCYKSLRSALGLGVAGPRGLVCAGGGMPSTTPTPSR